MFWMLVTAIVAGFAGAGIGYFVRVLSRKRLPVGIVPVFAGLAMIGATVALEYGWYPNTVGTMPDDLVVVSTREQQTWYQPWTYVSPFVRGFAGFSPSETTETAPGSDIYVVQMRLQERWQPQMVLPVLVDCAENRRAEIRPDTEFSEEGEPVASQRTAAGHDDPSLKAGSSGRTATG